jgi:hypothetical protein
MNIFKRQGFKDVKLEKDSSPTAVDAVGIFLGDEIAGRLKGSLSDEDFEAIGACMVSLGDVIAQMSVPGLRLDVETRGKSFFGVMFVNGQYLRSWSNSNLMGMVCQMMRGVAEYNAEQLELPVQKANTMQHWASCLGDQCVILDDSAHKIRSGIYTRRRETPDDAGSGESTDD